jgi:hypothetical protein
MQHQKHREEIGKTSGGKFDKVARENRILTEPENKEQHY